MRARATDSFGGGVEELQGLYGAFSFPERLFQQIWQRRDYAAGALRLADGRPIRVVYPGKWNHLGGPDFSDARLVIDGHEIVGDVELHLHAHDWAAHGHAADPAYARVVLHVVLFPGNGAATLGAGGVRIPVLCLLPWLHHALEEYAAEDAMERMAGRPLHKAAEVLGALSRQELDTLLGDHAGRRWRGKVHFARGRIKRLGWAVACHHTAMEILGYRFNRTPMLTAAAIWPLERWGRGDVASDDVFAELRDRWSVQGVRPLNHPRRRLAQYADWCRARPDWTDQLRSQARLRDLATSTTGFEDGVARWRRTVGLTACRSDLCEELCGGFVTGSRFDNIVTDGFMPLVAAETGLELERAWRGWFAGDAPEVVPPILRELGVFDGRANPVSQGPVQGLLGWMIAEDAANRE